MSSPRPKILIADDQPDVLEALRLLLKGEDFRTESASSPAAILEALARTDFDVLLMDLNYSRDTTSGREGLDLLTAIREIDAFLPIVVMTAWGSIEGAVEAMKRGAGDYVPKPWENSRLLATLRIQVELGRTLRQNRKLEAANRRLRGPGSPLIIAESPAMRSVLELVDRVAPSRTTILITGESGTGKEVIARTIHARSDRASSPYVTVNAGGLGEGVLESELFGHVRGAFTGAEQDRVGCFELADGGTLFLDEIANMPARQQAKLLRVLETGDVQRVGSSKAVRVDIRIVAATNADIEAEIRSGQFREDLLYRLNTVEVHLPPLRDRREDIPPLAAHFLAAEAQRHRKPRLTFHPLALQALIEHAWPGNVRELEHAIERAVLVAASAEIQVSDLGLRDRTRRQALFEEMTLDEVERLLIQKALSRHAGNANRAAEALGLSRSAFYRRLQRYGLGSDAERP